MWAKTSSKAWEDFNVHKAFNKALTAAYKFKYQMADEDESDEWDKWEESNPLKKLQSTSPIQRVRRAVRQEKNLGDRV